MTHVCGGGWVCEFHPMEAWPHLLCTGAGMPCQVCNPDADSRFDRTLASTTLARFDPEVGRRDLGEMWALHHRARALTCRLHTHELGWELRVEIDREMARTQLCRHEADVFALADEWKAEAEGKDWTAA